MTHPSAIGGIRVSTADQTSGYGPDRQREGIQQEADRNGLELIDWVEETISGADHDRAAENRYFTLAGLVPLVWGFWIRRKKPEGRA